MTVINLKRYYYPLVKTDVFVEVPDEIADALLHLRREENNRTSKIWYHKAYFSLDCEDGIENDAIGWAQPSPEDYMIQAEDEAAQELLLEHLWEAIGQLTPTQARRLHMRYMDLCQYFGQKKSKDYAVFLSSSSSSYNKFVSKENSLQTYSFLV